MRREDKRVMKNFRRMFVVKNGESGGWTNVDKTVFVIAVEYDTLSVKVKAGRDMYVYEINTAIGKFLEAYERKFKEGISVYERKVQYRFVYDTGVSGCQDTYIETDDGDGFPTRKFLMHQSCFDKCGGFKCFVYDFLDLCVASGFLTVEDGVYRYDESKDEAAANLDMTVITPRLVDQEDGWSWSDAGIVPLSVCRESPDPEGELEDEECCDEDEDDEE